MTYTLVSIFEVLSSSVVAGFLIAFMVMIIGLTIYGLLKIIKKS